MSLRQLFHSNRTLRFTIIHAMFSVVVGIWIIKNLTPNEGTIFPRYFITFVEAFLGSLGFAFLSLVLLVKSFFLGYGNAGVLNVSGHPVPLPVAAGVAAFLAFAFIWMGWRVHSRLMMSVMLAAGSLLLFVSSFSCIRIPHMTDRLLGL